jgi:hypothetical protein
MSIFGLELVSLSTTSTTTAATTNTATSSSSNLPFLFSHLQIRMDTNYLSQIAWIKFRMDRQGRTKPVNQIGQKVDCVETFRGNLRAVDIKFPGAPHSLLVFLAELRTVREFCR